MKKITLMGLSLAMLAGIGQQAAAQVGYPSYSEDTFKVLGEGMFRDDIVTFIYSSKPRSWKVTVEESVEHPGVYRVLEPYKNSGYGTYIPNTEFDQYLYIDASDPEFVYMQNYRTGIYSGQEIDENGNYILDENGEPYKCQYEVGSIAGCNTIIYGWDSGRLNTIDDGDQGQIYLGSITFPTGSLLVRNASDRETDPYKSYIWMPTNRHGEFCLRLPGAPDTDMKVTIGDYREVSEDEVWIPASFNYSFDLDKAVVMMQRGEYSPRVMEDFANGLIEGKTIYDDHATIEYPFEGSDVYTAYMLGYLDDEVVSRQYASREIRIDRDWLPLSTYGQWREVFISDNQLTEEGWMQGVVEPRDYYINIEQNSKNAGEIRLVNPYTNNAPTYYYYANEDTYDNDHMYYVYFDLSNPDRVFMRTTENGIGLNVDWAGGKVRISSRAYRYTTSGGPIYVGTEVDDYGQEKDVYEVRIWTPEEVEEHNLYGKYDAQAQTITFPTCALCVDFNAKPNSWYYSNYNDEFIIRLPRDFSSVETVIAEAAEDVDAPVVYYNLQGMRVQNPEHGRIYIKVQGTKSSKVRF